MGNTDGTYDVGHCDVREIGVGKEEHKAFIYDRNLQIWVILLE